MTLATSPLRKRVSVLLMALLTAQPVLAQTMQYQIPLFGSRYAMPPPGTGEGDVDTGENPVEAAPPKLEARPSALQFESIPGTPPTTLQSLVVNTGTVPAKVAGISSNENFDINHNCTTLLPVGASCQISATPTTKAPSGVTYNMAVTALGTVTPTILSLSTYERLTEGPAPRLALSNSMVAMGPLKPGERANRSTELSNIGTAAATVEGIKSGAGFAITDNCPDTLDVGATCTISASFASYDARTHSHSMNLSAGQAGPATMLTFYADVPADPAIAPALELDQSMLNFGPMGAGTSETKKAVLINRGTAPALLSGIEATAPFSLTSACPAQLAVGASCDILVTFHAFTQGTSPAQWLTIKAQNNVSTRLLLQGRVSGSGSDSLAPNLVFAPEGLAFGGLAVGQSATLDAVVKNEGAAEAKISGIKIDFGSANFSQTNDCPSTLAASASCRVTVTFKATAAAMSSGRVLINMSNGSSGVLPLSGQGQHALLSAGPPHLDFGVVALPGTTSRSVSLSNQGNQPLTGLAVSNSHPRLSVNYGTCTSTLEAKKSCVLTLTYAPSSTGSFEGDISVASTNGGSTEINWGGVAVKLTASPSTLIFAETLLGASAPDELATLTNNGSHPLQLGAIGVFNGTAHFGQSNNCGTSLAAGASCSVRVRYTPSTPGAHAGELGILVQGELVGRIALNGTSIEAKLRLSKTTLQFAPTNIGQGSEVLSVTVTNPTSKSVTITGMGISSGDSEFAQSNNCGTALAPGASCSSNVQMTPTAKTWSNGTLTLDSSFGLQHVALAGQGTAPDGDIEDGQNAPGTPPTQPGNGSSTPVDDGFTHYSITFLDTEVANPSAVRNVKFSNKGDGPLKLLGLSITKGETDFTQTNNCNTTLAPGAYCTISLVFTPSELGARTGGIALLSDGGKFFFNLNGKGVGAVGAWRADSDSNFGTVDVATSAQRSFTFSNTGTMAAREVSVKLIGEQLRLVTNTCGEPGKAISLPVGDSCRVSVEYAPAVGGTLKDAMLQASGTLANGPVTHGLTGKALDDVALLLHMDDAGNTVTDSSPAARTVTMGSGVSMVSTHSVTGGRSLSFNGSPTANLSTASDAAFNFGAKDFTVEGWVYLKGFNSVASGIFQQSSGKLFGNGNPSNSVALGTVDSTGWQIYAANTYMVLNERPVPNVWTHVALVRYNGFTTFYLNGVEKLKLRDTVTYTGDLFGVGAIWSPNYSLNGYLDEFRVTRGRARYTSNFTPSTAPLPNP